MSDENKSVDDIVGEFRKYNKAAGKDFDDRVKKYEEFFDPEKLFDTRFKQHAEYIIRGKPGDDNYPGAYNEAYKKLDEKISGNYDKLEDDDLIKEIIESYVDTFLKKAATEQLEKAEELAKQKGLSREDILKIKGNLFAKYHRTQQGSLNPLDDEWIKQNIKGKNKIEVIELLKELAGSSEKAYTQYLASKAIGEIFDHEDEYHLAEYFEPKFEKEGWKHDDHLLTHGYDKLKGGIDSLLTGSGENLQKLGYKKYNPEE